MASIATILGYINTAIALANAAIAAGRDAGPIVAAIKKLFGKEEITQADLDELAAETDRLSAELQLPLPDGE